MEVERSSTGFGQHRAATGWAVAEVVLIFLVFFLYAGWPAPEVNEAHYLARAKHFWNPQWCPGDFFLESADAHLMVNWVFGWLSLFVSLPALAWIGRVVCWALAAAGWRWLSVAIVPGRLTALLTAALLLVLIAHCQMAGEWVIGGFEAKSVAYGLVFFGLGCAVRDRWRAAWPLLGLASAFHVLVGGWATVAAGLTWLSGGRPRRSLIGMLPALLAGLVLALPGIVPGLLLSWGSDPAAVRQANQIYVFQRLAHHLAFHEFAVAGVLRHTGLFLFCLVLWRRSSPSESERRLRRMVMAAFLLAGAGAAIDLVSLSRPELAASLLRYYWFRLPDVLVPAGAALTVVAALRRWEVERPQTVRACLAGLIVLAAWQIGGPSLARRHAPLPGADLQALGVSPSRERAVRPQVEAWRRCCQWVAQSTRGDARFLTPRRQQTFHWYAGRAEVVCWKNVPQDAEAIVEWGRRVAEIFPPQVSLQGLASLGERRIRELAAQYDASYVIIDRTRSPRRLDLPMVYPSGDDWNPYYQIYWIAPQVADGRALSGPD